MVVLGLSCNVDAAELVVVALRLEITDEGVASHVAVMEHRTDPGEDHAKKLASVQADLETSIKNRAADAKVAVVRSMDTPPFVRRGITKEQEARLEIQGVVLSTLRRQIDRVTAMNGQQIGRTCKSDKPTVLADAKKQFGEVYQEAGIAALAAMALARG